MDIELRQVRYFAKLETSLPELFKVLSEVVDDTLASTAGSSEFEEKFRNLLGHPEPWGEQRRQAVDLMCEMLSYHRILASGFKPTWVPRHKAPMPDLEYEKGGVHFPVEVKHLNDPRDEDIVLSSGQILHGEVNHEFQDPVMRKVDGYCGHAVEKFKAFNLLFNSLDSSKGELDIHYSVGIDAMLSPEKSMHAIILDQALQVSGDVEVNVMKIAEECASAT